MKKILLTGGSGFIGKNILESYLIDKYEIIAPKSSEFDLLDTESVDKFLRNKEYDILLHSATKPVHRTAIDTSSILYNNLLMFQNLERHKERFRKFINFSSGAIYDNSKDVTNVREGEVFTNIPSAFHYGLSKYIIHKELLSIQNSIDLFIFGIFGKYDYYEVRLVPNLICKAIFDLPLSMHQNRIYHLISMDDFISILDKIIEVNKPLPKGVNIVPDYVYNFQDIASLIQTISGKQLDIQFEKSGFGKNFYASNDLLKSFFDVNFTPFENAIEKLYRFYHDNQTIIEQSLLYLNK